MNISNADALYIYKALKRLEALEPDYPGLKAGIHRFSSVSQANEPGTELAKSSWWEEQLERDMRSLEKDRWMEEQPF